MENSTMSKAVAKKDEQAMAMAGAYAATNVATHDELDRDSFSIPRLAVLEKMSPEVDDASSEYIEGAKAGQLCNKVMGELYPEGLLVIPVQRRRVYLQWVPRDAGGGFVAEHDVPTGERLMQQTTRNEKNVDILVNKETGEVTELHNVLEFYVIYSPDGGESWNPAILSMSRTRMAEGKKWNTRIEAFKRGGVAVTQLAQVYELGTARREKDGNASYLFKVGDAHFLPDLLPDTHEAVFAEAQKFLEQLGSGAAKVDREAEATAPHNHQPGGRGDSDVDF